MKKKKLTIGIFTDAFFPMTDGVIMVVDNYAKRLAEYANVIVFAPKYLNNDFDDSIFNYKVVRSFSVKVPLIDYSLPIPKMDPKFQKELKKYQLDLVHIHSPFTIGEAGVQYAKKNNIPVVGTMHSQFKQDFLRAVKSEKLADLLTKKIIRVFNKCDECFTVNEEIARIFHEEYGYKKKPIIIHNATDMTKLDDNAKIIPKIEQKYHLNKNDKVFLFVGRINKLKNIFFIADVLQKLKEIKLDFKFKMLFVGCGQDEKEFQKYIDKLRLNKEVIFCGKILNREILAGVYKRADLFLFPSFYDTNSLVQLEASSQELPTLFVKGSGTSAMVSDNINGYIEEFDVLKYAKRIVNIFNDSKLYDKVSKNAYKDLYVNWNDVCKDLYQNYLKIIEKKNINE